jgi:hypothetical protein
MGIPMSTHTCPLLDDHYPHPPGRFKAITTLAPFYPGNLMPGPATADYDEDDHGVVWLEMMGEEGAAVCEEACRGAGHGGDSGLRP